MKTIQLPLFVMAAMLLMAMGIDLSSLLNYANQTRPVYIAKDNTPPGNPITDAGATLGRVMFYDKTLSVNKTIACASCHKQAFAFGDTARLSTGLDGGLTGRHSMRLVNSRFGNEMKFFWDERATSLEDQTTRPIQDHVEMGFSGSSGYPDLDSLMRRMAMTSYYPRLFEFVYGDSNITEIRIQRALAQFIRSIQSFDSKFDAGRVLVQNVNDPFPNFTAQENQGKNLFLAPPGGANGGMGCQGCHRAPEFDIDPQSLNNGVVANAQNSTLLDLTNTRSPSLRDIVNPQGMLNGPLMHNGNFTTIRQVLNHYNQIPPNPNNNSLDPRLAGPNGNGQVLNMTPQQLDAVEAFLRTLNGVNVYTDVRWSDPFDANGNLTVLPVITSAAQDMSSVSGMRLYPNPARNFIRLELNPGAYDLYIYGMDGREYLHQYATGSTELNIESLPDGMMQMIALRREDGKKFVGRFLRME